MQELSVENINTIEAEVSHSGITFSHLREEMIDHICCDVEREMQQGLSFEVAFEKMRGIIGNKGLKKVQENTLLLIDKKYRIMKKTMKVFGLVSMLLMTIGAILKIMHLPLAGILLMLGFTLMALVFLPAALYVMKKEITMKGARFIFAIALIGGIPLLFGILFKIQHWPGAGILLLMGYLIVSLLLIPALLISKLKDENSKNLKGAYILGAISISLYLLGDLFKIMHYPGAGPLLVLGAIMLTTVFLPVYGLKAYKNSTYVKGGFIYLCIGIFFFNLFNILLAMNVSKDVLSFYIKPGQEILLTTQLIEQQNDSLIARCQQTDSLKMNSLLQITKSADELFKYVEDLKISLIKTTDNISEEQAILRAKTPALILYKDNFDISTMLLCGTEPDFKNGKASELKQKIEKYRTMLLKYCDSAKNAATIINLALDTKIKETPDNPIISWELYHFYHLPLVATVNKLGTFQRNIRIAEQELIKHLVVNTSANKISQAI